MTIKQLKAELDKYDENLEVRLQYQDGGGIYGGNTDVSYIDLEDDYFYRSVNGEKERVIGKILVLA